MENSPLCMRLFLETNKMLSRTTGNLFFVDPIEPRQVTVRVGSRKGFCVRFWIYLAAAACYTGRIIEKKMSLDKESSAGHAAGRNVAMVENILMCVMTAVVAYQFYQRAYNPELIVRFINGLETIQRKFVREFEPELRPKVKLLKLFCQMNKNIIVPGLPVIMAVVCGFRPRAPMSIVGACLQELVPANPVDDLIQAVKHNKFPSGEIVCLLGTVVLTIVVNYMFWVNMHKAGLCLAVDVLLGPICLTSANITHKRTLTSLLTKSVAVLKNNILLRTTLRSFKTLELLTNHFNSFARHLLIYLFVACCTGQVISAWVLISPQAGMATSFPLKCFFIVVLVDTIVVILLVFGLAADLHLQSSHVVSFLSKRRFVRSSRYLHRYIRSCKVLRVELGISSFVDKETPLVMEVFSTHRMVDMLLLT